MSRSGLELHVHEGDLRSGDSPHGREAGQLSGLWGSARGARSVRAQVASGRCGHLGAIEAGCTRRTGQRPPSHGRPPARGPAGCRSPAGCGRGSPVSKKTLSLGLDRPLALLRPGYGVASLRPIEGHDAPYPTRPRARGCSRSSWSSSCMQAARRPSRLDLPTSASPSRPGSSTTPRVASMATSMQTLHSRGD